MTAAAPTNPLPGDPAPDAHPLAGLAYRVTADGTARRPAISALIGAAATPAQLHAASVALDAALPDSPQRRRAHTLLAAAAAATWTARAHRDAAAHPHRGR